MPLIILEGPDESGKSTLAKKLQATYSPAFDNQIEIQRSPIKDWGWKHEYDHYTDQLARATLGQLVIQDRVPEISESVYGYTRAVRRSSGWLSEFGDWCHHDIFLVFCKGPKELEDTHKDAEGWLVSQTTNLLVQNLYEYTYEMMEGFLATSKIANFQVAKYDRFAPDQDRFLWELSFWLRHIWPSKRFTFDALEAGE